MEWDLELEELTAQARKRTERGWEETAPPLERLFRRRLRAIYSCRVPFFLEFHSRPTTVALGRYYRSKHLIRVYSFDLHAGPRQVEELFEVFLHELAHHIEYHEPDRFGGECQRKPGLAHSPLFLLIWATLQDRWRQVLARGQIGDETNC